MRGASGNGRPYREEGAASNRCFYPGNQILNNRGEIIIFLALAEIEGEHSIPNRCKYPFYEHPNPIIAAVNFRIQKVARCIYNLVM